MNGNFLLIFSLVLSFLAIFFTVIGIWTTFEKAHKPGWFSILPVYGTIVMFEISDMSLWYLLFCFIPYVNFLSLPIVYIALNINLAKNFGKDFVFGFGMAFFPFIFYPILGLGLAVYKQKYSDISEISIERNTDKIIEEKVKSKMTGEIGPNLAPAIEVSNTPTSTYIPSANPMLNNLTDQYEKPKKKEISPKLINKDAPDGLKKCGKCGTVSIMFNQKVCSNCGSKLK